MPKYSSFFWLVSGLILGALIVAVYKPDTAMAQTATAQNGVWQLGVSNWNQVNSAWRINTVTGTMELCAAYDGKPGCFIMPKPTN